MREKDVTREVVKWLSQNGWKILDYDFPGGGTGRKFHMNGDSCSKTRGIVIPDVIAIKNGTIILFENKAVDTLSDYIKVRELSISGQFSDLLHEAYQEVDFSVTLWAIAYGGEPKNIAAVEENHIGLVVNVRESEQTGKFCVIVWGSLPQ